MKKISTFLFILLFDQLIKYYFHLNQINHGFFSFSCNPVLSWNIPLSGLFFWFTWSLAFILLLSFTYRNNWNIFLLLTLSGALSNFLDRLFYDCVVDYLKINSFPIFNLADILITSGVLLFTLSTLKSKK